MGVRFRNATPGTLLLLAATALLAIVSFNTPLLKTLYFLHATFESGEYSGDLYLGTLGYCLTNGGKETCKGPTIGYEFNPNTLFGISMFNIPQTITKYLTYTFILHIIALAAAAGSFVFGLLSHISTMGVWCFPTCLASIASSISLLALVFDLVIFYIAKARIDDVTGASASIGICVWLVLAAWLLAGFGGCAFGIGNCCFGRRSSRNSGDDSKMDYYAQQHRSDDMRLQAMRDEQLRKKEQGLPSFQELERTPLTGQPEEDKYMYEEQPLPQSRQNGGLARDGSVLQGVGMGYGRRNPGDMAGGYNQGTFGNGYGGYETLQPPNLARRTSTASGVTAGNAGVGAGGQGVEQAEDPQQAQAQGYGGYYGNQNHNYYENYSDPYAQRPYEYANGGQSYDPNYPPNSYDPNQTHYDRSGSVPPQGQYDSNTSFPQAVPSSSMTMPTPQASGSNQLGAARYADPYESNTSSDSHYPDPGPRVSVADPYGGYDDALGGIGMAATSPNVDSAPGSPAGYGSSYAQRRGYDSGIQVPQPQHLVSSSSQNNLLRSPLSPRDSGEQAHHYRDEGDDDGTVDAMGNRPPSYGQIAGAAGGSGTDWRSAGRNEKSGYR